MDFQNHTTAQPKPKTKPTAEARRHGEDQNPFSPLICADEY